MKSSRAAFRQQQKEGGSRLAPTTSIPVVEAKDDRVKVSWRTGADVRTELKRVALERGCTVNDLLDEAVGSLLARNTNPEGENSDV